jgi:glycosyltransferase involved in cell wall biosynthesis
MAVALKSGNGTGALRPAQGLSVIVPLYNEAKGLPALHERLLQFAARLKRERGLAAEIVYVDDGSKDETFEVAHALPAGVDFQIVSFSRNFGKEAALRAGLDHARYDALLFMDGDGQHPP